MKLPRFALVGVLSLAVTLALTGVAGASTNSLGAPAQNPASLNSPVAHEGRCLKGDGAGWGGFWNRHEDKTRNGKKEPFSRAKHAGMFKDVRDQVQTLVGLDSAQLKAALQGGKSLAQIAQEQGIAQETLESKIQSTLEANLDQAVRDGKLTAEEAATVKADLPQRVQAMVARQHVGRSQS